MVVMGGKAADVLGIKYLVRVWPVGWWDRLFLSHNIISSVKQVALSIDGSLSRVL